MNRMQSRSVTIPVRTSQELLRSLDSLELEKDYLQAKFCYEFLT